MNIKLVGEGRADIQEQTAYALAASLPFILMHMQFNLHSCLVSKKAGNSTKYSSSELQHFPSPI